MPGRVHGPGPCAAARLDVTRGKIAVSTATALSSFKRFIVISASLGLLLANSCSRRWFLRGGSRFREPISGLVRRSLRSWSASHRCGDLKQGACTRPPREGASWRRGSHRRLTRGGSQPSSGSRKSSAESISFSSRSICWYCCRPASPLRRASNSRCRAVIRFSALGITSQKPESKPCLRGWRPLVSTRGRFFGGRLRGTVSALRELRTRLLIPPGATDGRPQRPRSRWGLFHFGFRLAASVEINFAFRNKLISDEGPTQWLKFQ